MSYLLSPIRRLSWRIVSLLWARLRVSSLGVLANMVESRCSMELWLRSNDLREPEISVKAEFGIATNWLCERLTVSTGEDWKTSRGNDLSLKIHKAPSLKAP